MKFDSCAGAIDGIPIWMHKPSMKEADAANVGQKSFYAVGRGSLASIVRPFVMFVDESLTY